MVGVITSWDVLSHPIVTIHCFGWGVFFRAVAPWQNRTFLSLLQPAAPPRPATIRAEPILERCIALELRAGRIYTALAHSFRSDALLQEFFTNLAAQEQEHADLLRIIRMGAMRCGWKAGVFNPWEVYLPRLEQAMDAAENALREIASVNAALQLVIEIESSEVNKLFGAAMAAADATFIHKLKPFQTAMESHLAYIAERIPSLSPGMASAGWAFQARNAF